MWFAKKQAMGGKSDDEKHQKQVRSPEKSVQHHTSATSRQVANESVPKHSLSQSDGKSKKPNTDVEHTSESVRQKPLIQLPQKPQIPVNTKPLNPLYKYKNISSIKSSDATEQSVNFFGVVNEIIKPISTTKTNKFMLQCIIIDDSDDNNGRIKFYFFTPEDTIVKQIEVGDIVRLHRVKLEFFNDGIDGRVFFNQDIVLFKKDCPDVKPITTAKNTIITDDDKKRVENLKKWYSQNRYLSKHILLSDICQSGKYNIFCKVVMCNPKKEGNTVKITVTDGSAIKNLVPALPLLRYKPKKDGKKDHIVTEIITHHKLDEYARLKVDDFVLFCDVAAVPSEDNKLRLEINNDTSPEVSVDKTLQVADIEWRIEQFRKSVNKDNEANDKNDSGTREQEDDVVIVENNQNILPSSSGQGIETLVQTRQQKNKQNSSPANDLVTTVHPACDNKSCLKAHSGKLNTKDDNDSKKTESDPGTKSRKQLFTPNYMTDLSDAATDETSEHNLEMAKHSPNKIPDEDVVNPANTNFNEIVEKVKTKYCTPKNQSLSQDEQIAAGRSSTRKTRNGSKLPVVILERLSGSEGYRDSRLNVSRKRGRNISDSQEDIEDAETVINISCQAANPGNKRKRLESLSTEEGNPRNDDADVDSELENRGKKVASWLFHPKNKIIVPFHDDIANDELDVPVIKQIIGCDSDSPDMSKYISSLCFRIKAFLLGVIPDPSSNTLDLVSGYCQSGCQQMFLFSTIKWLQGENSRIPLCPECTSIEQEKELQLMLMMELLIMDTTGRHGSVLVVRDHAEHFLNCTVGEFVKDKVLRTSRVRLLTDYTIHNTYRASVTPLLDITVSPLSNSSPTLVLVNSRLKLPRI